ncbi:MAG TPA: TetR/AcrR family transcriptional regulator [Bryobacteraceae bacterium]|nr:TetR/AcrR family transcriptional regulator [Bryobacteraceae bacterium]
MKKSKQETAETHEDILNAAALEFRRNGIAETGLSEVMASAGLTHGGFYRHFESKEQLVAEACEKAFATVLDEVERRATRNSAENTLSTLVNGYLSNRHRDDFRNACPLAALGSDLRRADAKTRKVASAGFDRFVSIVEGQLDKLPPPEAKARATSIMAAMVGAMVLARIVDKPSVSNRILKSTRELILRT